MTVALFLEALLLGDAYTSWTQTNAGSTNYYSRILTSEEYSYLVDDLSAILPFTGVINTLNVSVLNDGANASAYISVEI